ncbi:ciliogenesis and planar polarity effector 1 [Mantella aurantiaca]
MDLSLEVVLCTGIRRKKPCTRLCWLGQEKEGVFLVDENRIREISLRSGNVKKPLFKKISIVTIATSANGAWLAALHVSGELSLWSKDLDCLHTVPAIADISQLISVAQGSLLKLYLYVSGDGCRVLLVTHTGCVYLWEITEEKNRPNPQKTRTLSGRWTKIEPHDAVTFPGMADKEATVQAMFIKSEVLGDICLCTFTFYSDTRLMMTFLSLRWLEGEQKYNSTSPFNVHWSQQDCPLETIHPICEPVKSKGALVAAFSKDGLVLALAINQKDPKATYVIFVNTMNFVTVCGSLKGCSSRNQQIPTRYLRSYWVGGMSWASDSLFLACILKRGSLLLLTRLGELLTLTTFGCSVEFGPAEFIPLHPLITYRPPVPILESHNANDSLGSVASEADLMRQRFSVTCHPRLPYLIVSDGYMVTALRFAQNMSPYHFMKSLLLDSAQRLENVRQSLRIGKSKKNGIKLRSLSSLKATLLKDADKPPSVLSTVPSFLQDEEDVCGHLEKLLQDDDEESDDQEHLKYTAPPDSTFGRAEQGRLEFASMFDTIHASDQGMAKSDILSELLQIRKTLLTAWTTGVTMRSVSDLDSLLHYTVGCLSHFMSLLQNPKCPTLKSDKPSKASGRGDTLWASYFGVIQKCLAALYWDVSPRQAFGHMIKLSSEAIKLILVRHSQLYSKGLVEGFCLLKTVSQNLTAIYRLRFESVPAGLSVGNVVQHDIVQTPVFQSLKQPLKGSSLGYVFKEPPDAMTYSGASEKRLAVLWRLLYGQTLWYQTRLRKQMSLNQCMKLSPGVQSEEKAIVSLLCHLQAELQSANPHVSQSVRLLPVTGEENFLFGSYKESVEFWKRALLEVSLQGGSRAGLLQTRYYLAILYCHLYHYNLNDAQGLCDQLVKELLIRSDLLAETADEESDERLLEKIHPEATLAVIQSMGRFMAAYFTNQLLYVFPPHNVCVLAPLHITVERFPRVVTLQHSVVASAARDQNLSSVWTVEYALDLLLIGGLIPEAAWLANKLGDWKMSVSMVVAYNLHLKSIADENQEKLPSMPLYLSPAYIFQEKLQSFLGQPPHLEGLEKKHTETKQYTDPIEEEDADVLFNSVQEMLKAAVMADAEIVTETLRQLMESAKELIGRLPGLVPERLYLPAPPLYCPQPSSVSEEDPSDLLLQIEKRNRQKLSGVLQRILLLLRAAHCSLPVAQWYIKQIKKARKIMQKIRAKGALPPLSPLPEALLNYANGRTVFLKPGASGDLVSCSVVGCFRELCALCWMLHVRERLSLSCRRYQKARDSGKLFKSSDESDSCVTEHCFEALEWACRMLPFTRVTNCEELIQDIILSLISELPPVKKVAEIMVKAFPRPDDVRVPLREKFHSVQQRLRHSMIKGLEGEEMMSVVTHNVQRVRVKALRRIHRNIGPVEMHVWEPALDENTEDESHLYDRYSLGTSLSRSTLTDLARIYSDTDTLSDTFHNSATEDRADWHTPFSKPPLKQTPNKVRDRMKEGNEMPTENGATLPKVGSWEFECDDEEYTSFLDLFLSYLLEKDLLHSTEPGLPFLTSFAPHLREHELNSLAFDVHTTLKRKLGRPEIKSVYRAGSCYKVNADPRNDSAVDGTLTQIPNTTDPSPALCSTVILGKPVSSAEKYFHKMRSQPVKNGLFGLQDQKAQKCHEDDCRLTFSGYTFDEYSYSLIQSKHCKPSEELGAQLHAKYSNEVKLVEWMIRWSDRRLFWSTGKAELCHVGSNTAIRVKTSSAALLTSVWLLEKPYLVPPRQYIVAPVVHQVMKSSLQRESSVEGDNSESERGSLSVVHEEDPDLGEESDSRASSKESRVSGDRSQQRQYITFQETSVGDASVLSEHPMVEQIPIPSETEDDQPDTQRSPKISVSIRPVPTQVENVYTDTEQNAEDSEESFVEEIPERFRVPTVSTGSPLPEPSSRAVNVPPVPSTNLPENAADGGQSAVNVPPPPVPSSSLPETATDGGQSAVNVPPPPVPSTSLPDSAAHGGQSTQPANNSEAVGQLFQDEMFRLLQLQQINFMSLMQVVGSSFAALPAIQQVMQQTAQMTGNLVVNPTVRPAALQVIPPAAQINAHPRTQGVGMEHAAQMGKGETAEAMPADHSGNKENVQRPPEINIPSSQVNESDRIPANLGLLSTAPHQVLPLIVPTSPQKSLNLHPPPALSNFSGFPLLKLQTTPNLKSLNFLSGSQAKSSSRPEDRPPLREAWGPSDALIRKPSYQSSSHLNQSPAYPSSSIIKDGKRTEKATKWAQPVVQGQHSKHSAGNLPKANVPVCQPFFKSEEKRWRPEGSFLEVSQNNAGMPLLRLRADPVLYLPPMPSPSFTVSMVPPQAGTSDLSKGPPMAGFTLLKATLPQQAQSLQISPSPRLIPLQKLIAFERDAAQRGEPGSMQLLKANIQPFEEVASAGDSVKRQKRRTLKEKGEKKEKKTSVTFRPEDSIITPNNFDEIVQNEKVQNDEPNLMESNEFVIPLGTFESELADQIPGPLLPTMAELHYLASLTKRPPEVHHASTNTDPASKSLINQRTSYEAFSSSPVVASPPASAASESHKLPEDKRREEVQRCRLATSAPAAEDDLMSMGHQQTQLNRVAEEPGRKNGLSADHPLPLPPVLFLNLPYEAQEGKMFQEEDASPAHAEEHLLTVMDLNEEEFPGHIPGIEEMLPSSADLHLMAASKKNALPQELILNTDILQARPRLEVGQPGAVNSFIQPERSVDVTPRGLENNDAFYRLHEMDAQLRALQNMAESMERDFANTELLMKTIDNLATALDPDPKDVFPSREHAVPERELTLNEMALEDLVEEEEFTLPSPGAIRLHEHPRQVTITTPDPPLPTDHRQDRRTMEKSTVSEQLQMTGLSDIADILTDLMEGGVSASELGLSVTQAQAISRQRLRNISKRSQKDRAELRMWMKKKQRERLADYRKKLEELREREHKPFQTLHHTDTSSIQHTQKMKNEKDQMLLSEHHSRRVSDAMNLMQEMISDTHHIPAASTRPSRSQTSRQRVAQPSITGSRTAAHSLSAGHTERSRSASRAGTRQPKSTTSALHTQTRGTATFVLPKSISEPILRPRSVPSYAINRRYDPTLPGDRMSQITRRGMLTARNRGNVNSKATKPILKTTTKLFKPRHQDKSSKVTSPQSPVQEEYERDIVSPWELPEEIHRILYGSRNSLISQGTLAGGDNSANQDNASDSTGSLLSKLDWKAIEDLVASVGTT